MVIADTNIFYDLDNGVIAKSWFEKDQVVGTLASQLELAKSPNLINRLQVVKGAARAMNNHCTSIITLSPPDFIIRRFIPDYVTDEKWYASVKDSFELLLHPNFHLRISENDAKQIIEGYEKPFEDMRINENNRLLEKRKDVNFIKAIRDKEFRMAIRNTDFTNKTKQEIIKGLQQHHLENHPGQPLAIDINHSGWNDLELLLNLWTDYDKRFFDKQPRTIKRNDFIDIAITGYVGRGDLYWTNDEYFLEIMRSNPVTAKYLHPLCGKKRIL